MHPSPHTCGILYIFLLRHSERVMKPRAGWWSHTSWCWAFMASSSSTRKLERSNALTTGGRDSPTSSGQSSSSSSSSTVTVTAMTLVTCHLSRAEQATAINKTWIDTVIMALSDALQSRRCMVLVSDLHAVVFSDLELADRSSFSCRGWQQIALLGSVSSIVFTHTIMITDTNDNLNFCESITLKLTLHASLVEHFVIF